MGSSASHPPTTTRPSAQKKSGVDGKQQKGPSPQDVIIISDDDSPPPTSKRPSFAPLPRTSISARTGEKGKDGEKEGLDAVRKQGGGRVHGGRDERNQKEDAEKGRLRDTVPTQQQLGPKPAAQQTKINATATPSRSPTVPLSQTSQVMIANPVSSASSFHQTPSTNKTTTPQSPRTKPLVPDNIIDLTFDSPPPEREPPIHNLPIRPERNSTVKETHAAFSEAMKQWTGLLKEESEREPKARAMDVSGAASESKGKPARGEAEVMKQTSQRDLAVDREKHVHVGSVATGAPSMVESPSAGSSRLEKEARSVGNGMQVEVESCNRPSAAISHERSDSLEVNGQPEPKPPVITAEMWDRILNKSDSSRLGSDDGSESSNDLSVSEDDSEEPLPVITAEMWDRILNGTPNQDPSPASTSAAITQRRDSDAKETAPSSSTPRVKPALGDTTFMNSSKNESRDAPRRRTRSRSSSMTTVASSPSSRASSPEISLFDQTGDRKARNPLHSRTSDSKKRKRLSSNVDLDKLKSISAATAYKSAWPPFQLENEFQLNDVEKTNFKVFLAVYWDMNEQTIMRCCQRYQRFITSTLVDANLLAKQYFSDYRAIRKKVLELKREVGSHLAFPDKVLQRCDGCHGSTPSLKPLLDLEDAKMYCKHCIFAAQQLSGVEGALSG